MLNSLTKLNQLASTFIRRDDQRLGPGEVDALAAFYAGLAPTDQKKITKRVTELYRTSTFARDQKGIFIDRLTQAGLSLEKLEGVRGSGPGAFLRLGKEAQLWRLQRAEGKGLVKSIRSDDIPAGARAKIMAALDRFERSYGPQDLIGAPVFGARSFHAIHLEKGPRSRGKDLVGFRVNVDLDELHQEVTKRLYFNTKGERLGPEELEPRQPFVEARS